MTQRPSSKKNENSAITSFGISKRNLGDEPDIGKVARTGRAPLPKKHRRRGKGDDAGSMVEGKKNNLILIRWGIVTFLVATCVILVLTMQMTKTQSEEGAQTQRKIQAKFVGKEDESKSSGDKKNSPPSPEELESRAKAFLNAQNERELLACIRSSQIPQEEIFSMFEAACQEEGEVRKVSYLGPMDSRLFRGEAVQVKYASRHNRMIAFALGEDGSWKVDLDAFLRYNSLSIDTLLDGGDHEGVFRLFASKGSYYNGAYTDESKWMAFSLGSPDHGSLIIGYVDRKSPAFDSMRLALNKAVGFAPSSNRGAKPIQVTLKLAHRKGNEARQIEILDVLSDGWVIPDKPAQQTPAQ